MLLTVNAGSSSVKLALFPPDPAGRAVFTHTADRLDPAALEDSRALDEVVRVLDPHGGLGAVRAVGHRFVHGGPRYDGPRALTADVLGELRRLAALDPDHLPAQIALAEGMRARTPGVPHVACFDTTFHRTMPEVARLVPVAQRFRDQGVERYGFHGLSYTFLVGELRRVAGEAAARGRVVIAHLGSGASLVALREGRSVDTTMGFTPNSGIPMGTRSGELDPGVVLYLLRAGGLDADALERTLNRESGLKGLSGSSSDMRDLLAREANDERAAAAVGVFCYRTRQAVGALAATLGGLETLVFSGGIGERAAPVRARIAEGLGHLGVHVDGARNDRHQAVISFEGSPCTVRVIPTDEQAVIARETRQVVEAMRGTR
jgi:acetate kinase